MNARAGAGIGAAAGAAAGFFGGGAIYARRSRKIQTNAAIWGTFLGGVFGAVIGAPSGEGLKNQCAAGTLSGGRFP